MTWAAEEVGEIDLGEPRLNKRGIALLETLASKPRAGSLSANAGWFEKKGRIAS
ncbi:MAG: transposase [Candidatus Accumulibacter sp.]|uniref:IS4/Tn5 family transposase DNA-binding protein n=1 Tax=Accumulibacter sp. TaxID=2053492 RepID=UPI002590E83D|nr:transposase DNA-binding-containing protein [Accumulibacter sp.]MCM8622168.1 transposase [Accumulibacter sp.]